MRAISTWNAALSVCWPWHTGQAAELAFKLVVNDSRGGSAELLVNVSVRAVSPPVGESGGSSGGGATSSIWYARCQSLPTEGSESACSIGAPCGDDAGCWGTDMGMR